MLIEKIEIKEFRKFKDTTIHIGEYITCLAGHNAVGKSTILGLLGHCAEFKKQDGVTVFNQPFRAHLNDIIRFSQSFDHSGSNLYTISFKNIPELNSVEQPSKISFRSYWTDSRYKLIPMKTSERTTEKKIKWPTFYLGLSRLYPVGESERIDTTKNNKKLTTEDVKYIFNNYEEILSSSEKYIDITTINVLDVRKKNAFGVSTDHYDYLANSAGQDNLSQIIASVLSFKKLKESIGDEWSGGLLLIDELDATLHPAAQNKLFDFLFKQAKEIGIQIIFTTHSLSLLEHIRYKIEYNNNDNSNNIELCYLTTANLKLEVFRNIDISGIYYDLTCTYQGMYPPKQILVYSEDEETRWFFKHILRYAMDNISGFPAIINNIKFLEIKLGAEQLLTLLAQDFDYFKTCIFLLDGDVKDTTINKYKKKLFTTSEQSEDVNRVILKLPGNKSPEETLYKYLIELDEDSPFFTPERFLQGITFNTLKNNGPFSKQYDNLTKERERYKKWFEHNKYIFLEEFIYFWMKDNHDNICNFLCTLEQVYNFAATINNMQTITIFQKIKDSMRNEVSAQVLTFT